MATLRRSYENFRGAVGRAETSFSAMQLPDTRSPERADLVVAFEHTSALTTALADFLDSVDRALGSEGSDPLQPRCAIDDVRAFLLEVEPSSHPPTPGAFHPGVSKGNTAIGKLGWFYEFHIALGNRLVANRVPRSFVWRRSVALWQSVVYHGGGTASGGLLARLDFLSGLPGARRKPRAQEYYPWDGHDVRHLRSVAQRADFLAKASEETLVTMWRSEWCKVIDMWIEAGPRVGAAGRVFSDLIAEAPAPNSELNARLTTLAGLEYIGEETRRQALAKVR